MALLDRLRVVQSQTINAITACTQHQQSISQHCGPSEWDNEIASSCTENRALKYRRRCPRAEKHCQHAAILYWSYRYKPEGPAAQVLPVVE